MTPKQRSLCQLKAKNSKLSNELSVVSLRLQESSSDLSTVQTELDLVMRQLAEKDALCIEQSRQVNILNEQLESLKQQHTGMSVVGWCKFKMEHDLKPSVNDVWQKALFLCFFSTFDSVNFLYTLCLYSCLCAGGLETIQLN